jgi:hypothetical protein
MARTTKQLSGGGKDKFLRAVVAGEPGLPADAAARLSEALCTSIADIRVRRDTWETLRDAKLGTAAFSADQELQKQGADEKVAVPTAAFDPFVFSALAVLTKKGAAALSARLAEVTTAENLHALANAQHLSVDAKLADLAAIRVAILAATEARLAERRAAAS